MKQETIVKSIRIEKKLAEMIEAQASKENRNFSNTVETILKQFFSKKNEAT